MKHFGRKKIFTSILAVIVLGLALLFGRGWQAPVAEKILFGERQTSADLELAGDTLLPLTQTADGVVIKSAGEFYLLYSQAFSYREFDRLWLDVSSNLSLSITAIANYSTTGDYTYELRRIISPGRTISRYEIPLRHRLFKHTDEWAIKFAPQAGGSDMPDSSNPMSVTIRQISLSRSSPGARLVAAWQQFWRVAPYSPFTVNLLPTPLVFGRAGFVYFLPVFFALFFWLVFGKTHQRWALLGILLLWLLFDARLGYEFLGYGLADYKEWTRPTQPAAKSLRGSGDFYAFASWLPGSLPLDTTAARFLSPYDLHRPRVLQYYLYPVRLAEGDEENLPMVVYYQPGVFWQPSDRRLYLGTQAITGPGEVRGVFSDQAFIFVPDNAKL